MGVAALTLLISGALLVVTGASFALVGRAVRRHPAGERHRVGLLGAVAWWWGLAAYLLLQGSLTLWAGAYGLPVEAYLASRLASVPLICGAAWGITFHLVYLYTGSRRAGAALGVLYALTAVLFLYATFTHEPRALSGDRWNVTLEGGDADPLVRIVYVLVGVPPIAASLAYLSLLRRAEDPLQRWRILLVAGSILAYVGSGLAARLALGDAPKLATLAVLGLAAAAAALAAYYPPRAVRRALESRSAG